MALQLVSPVRDGRPKAKRRGQILLFSSSAVERCTLLCARTRRKPFLLVTPTWSGSTKAPRAASLAATEWPMLSMKQIPCRGRFTGLSVVLCPDGKTSAAGYLFHRKHRPLDRKSTRLNSSHGYISY